MCVCDNNEGKQSTTIIKPIKYNKQKDLSLVELIPITGRQHQLRVHMYFLGHKILGDPIYGVDDIEAEAYLNKTQSKENRELASNSYRLWLHANYLEFSYQNVIYKIYSKNKALYEEFYS